MREKEGIEGMYLVLWWGIARLHRNEDVSVDSDSDCGAVNKTPY